MMRLRLLVIVSTVIVGNFLAGQAMAHPATGIVVDQRGSVYFSDLETIWKIEPNGKLSVFRAGVRGRHVHELSIDEQQNIFGADISYEPSTERWNSSLWRMRPSGEFTYLQSPTHTPPSGLSILQDRHGNMYSVEQNNHLKRETLILRRDPHGAVTVLAGGAYGFADGKGSKAQFSSIGGMAIGPDDTLYVTEAARIRRIQADGTVTTLASGLDVAIDGDQPKWMGGLTGIGANSDGSVFVTDTGRRRVLRVNTEGRIDVIARAEPPYFPNGVFVHAGDVYVLEVGLTLPNAWSGSRVRKITTDGKNQILATVGVGDSSSIRTALTQSVGLSAERVLAFFYWNTGALFGFGAVISGIVVVLTAVWYRRKKVVNGKS